MSPAPDAMDDLFAGERRATVLAPGAVLLAGHAAPAARRLIAEIGALSRQAPFRHMETRGGRTMSVAMFNIGAFGWVSDRSGYRYAAIDPATGRPWPPLTPALLRVAHDAAASAGYPGFAPDVCLVNRYAPGARMGLHQDVDETDRASPIVSVSLGLPATFVWGGLSRRDPVTRHRLCHGDVVVWGGPARTAFHGVDALKPGQHPDTGAVRYNLTFRKV